MITSASGVFVARSADGTWGVTDPDGRYEGLACDTLWLFGNAMLLTTTFFIVAGGPMVWAPVGVTFDSVEITCCGESFSVTGYYGVNTVRWVCEVRM